MTRLLSVLCLVLWLSGCAAQQSTTTAAADTSAETKKDCSNNFRGTASNGKQCSASTCPKN